MPPLTALASGCYHDPTMDQDRLAHALERVERMLRGYVERSPYRLNPDLVTVRHVRDGLAEHLVLHGRMYCPCREVTGAPERDRPNICPCTTHAEEIARTGACECGIFVSADYAKEAR